MGFGNLPALTPHVKSGLLKPLAITSATRNPAFPDVPAIGETAIKGYEVYEWNGMFVPSGTPAAIVTQLNAAVRDVLALAEVKARFDNLGSRIVASTPEAIRQTPRRRAQQMGRYRQIRGHSKGMKAIGENVPTSHRRGQWP